MKLGRIKETDDSHAVFERLAKRHQRYLARIQESQITGLLNKLLKHHREQQGKNMQQLNSKVDAKQFYKQYDNKDLNKLNEEDLAKEKSKMDTVFNQNFKKPGDRDYEYDVQKDFEPCEDNEWDESDELDYL